jgi:hypothetical protein
MSPKDRIHLNVQETSKKYNGVCATVYFIHFLTIIADFKSKFI